MNPFRRLTPFLFILLLLAACKRPAGEADTFSFTILQMNDVYEIAPLEGGKAGGLARVATVRQRLEEENPNTLVVLAGDFLSPSLMANLRKPDGEKIAGQQMIETLNALGLDYATFGNHEFDLSDPDLLQKRLDQSEFRYVSCNARQISGKDTLPFTQLVDGERVDIPDYIIHEFETPGGKTFKLGIIGVLLPFAQQDYLHYLPVETSFRAAYQELRPKVDAVIALTHLSLGEDQALATVVPGIPLFLGGHEHENMSVPVGGTTIAKADANAKTVYVHRLTYSGRTKNLTFDSELQKIDESIPEEPKTQQVVDKWQQEMESILKDQGFEPGRVLLRTEVSLECTEVVIRNRQTNMGKLTLQAFEAAMPGADAYVLNSGSMRLDDRITGTITEYDILRTFPFGGPIVSMRMRGDTLAMLIKTGLTENKGEGGYLQIWKASFENGVPGLGERYLDPNEYYRVVMPEFVAMGRESNLGFLKGKPYANPEILTEDRPGLRNDIRDIVIAYFGEMEVYRED